MYYACERFSDWLSESSFVLLGGEHLTYSRRWLDVETRWIFRFALGRFLELRVL